ncbi:pyrroloquinoline quinone-dependent dehydrogenase [Swingsia samuiensis]|uniref:Pyrroloquinoline quinone-dependent dehydrogenase n=1 Tax=Swingsia samuiensis TaxID=1293412 RepID=A0A4Y6UK50_9PROT|nr:pyrroloquinoline quinone-dependent dehydrogenase [Swingsia samuiensis]QDH17018.1 pyrroloquinoline quinone-dependent dehydrogenase [Swingsia samuiensis]
MKRFYLLATVAGLSVASMTGAAYAQVQPSDTVPDVSNSEPTDKTDAPSGKFAAPSPYAPQAPGVNAANLPDIDSIDPSQLPAMVPQQSAHPASGDWAAYGHDDTQQRYSSLSEITPENVGQLKVAFVYHTGSYPRPGQVNKWAAETTPIKVGDGLYTCSAMNDLIKLDPATGKQIWRRDVDVKYHSIPYTAACKGVTYFTSSQVPEGQPCHNRIIEGTLDMRLIAVDAATGQFCPNFGHNGQVNLMQGMGESVPGFVATTAPPPVINGVVVVNHEVLDGQRRWAPSGVIRGYDAETGKFVWAWDVNNPNDHSQPTGDHHYSRGTPNSWAAMTGDNELGLVYVPTGNSAADYYSALRSSEENKVSSAVVAIDVKTGSPRWVFQTTHKDVWDYDIGSQATLIDMPGPDGKTIPALIMPTKRGETFVLDRRTGKPVLPVEERKAPSPGMIPDDPRAPTQPWSVAMPQLKMPDLKETDMWGMTPIDQLFCRVKFRRAHYVGEFTPPSLDKPWIEYPSYNGGSDWGSMSYDPQSGILIANWNNMAMYDQLVTRKQADKLGLMPIDDPNFKPGGGGAEGNGAMADTPYAIVVSPFWNQYTKMLCTKPPYGMITAIDMKHGHKVLWQHPLGTARANGPWGLPTGLPWEIGTPNNGGSVVTAGGLIFIAAATDNMIRAIDEKTGKVLWSAVLPGGGQANPMTYEANGHQYVAIMAGGHHFMATPVTDQLVVFALPDAKK